MTNLSMTGLRILKAINAKDGATRSDMFDCMGNVSPLKIKSECGQLVHDKLVFKDGKTYRFTDKGHKQMADITKRDSEVFA